MDCLRHAESGDVADDSTHASAAPVPPVEMLPKDVAADEVVAEAAPEKAEARRLWLHASLASSPGAFGFFRTARAEPLGDNLRLLLNYDLPGTVPPATGVPQQLLGGWYCWSLLHPDNLDPYSFLMQGVTTLLKVLAFPPSAAAVPITGRFECDSMPKPPSHGHISRYNTWACRCGSHAGARRAIRPDA